jgi:hypothetical protein
VQRARTPFSGNVRFLLGCLTPRRFLRQHRIAAQSPAVEARLTNG